MNFLFWNIAKKDLKESVTNICLAHDIDILILAEPNFNPAAFQVELNRDNSGYCHVYSLCQKIEIFTKFNQDLSRAVYESDRYTIRLFSIPNHLPFLETAIHFIDKSSHSDESQYEEATSISQKINTIEERFELENNIIVGDFNMNPFEKGMMKASGFNTIMCKKIANTIQRTVQGNEYKYFYNPMWNLFGDYNDVPGTYFYQKAEHINYKWNIFDQVIFRPSLIDRFRIESLQILINDGINDLIKPNGRPDKDNFSDHLPLKFSINLIE